MHVKGNRVVCSRGFVYVFLRLCSSVMYMLLCVIYEWPRVHASERPYKSLSDVIVKIFFFHCNTLWPQRPLQILMLSLTVQHDCISIHRYLYMQCTHSFYCKISLWAASKMSNLRCLYTELKLLCACSNAVWRRNVAQKAD